MPRPRIKATLIGSPDHHGDVEFHEFRRFCTNLAHSLRAVEHRVLPDGSLRYRLVDLKKGSATLIIEPISSEDSPDAASEVINLYSETVSSLQYGRPVDPRLSSEDLMTFRSLAVSANGQPRATIAGIEITSQFVANIDQIIGMTIPSEGSVKGRLERLNLHRKNEFVVYPAIAGYSVVCSFPDELFPEVHKGIKQNVTVFGTLFFRPDRPFPERVQAKSLEIHPPDDELPNLQSLRGTWKGCTGDLSVVEFIRALRDE